MTSRQVTWRRWLAVPLALATGAVASATAASECGPSFSDGGPDAEAYGGAARYPVAAIAHRAEQRFIVGSHVSFDRLLPGPAVGAPQHERIRSGTDCCASLTDAGDPQHLIQLSNSPRLRSDELRRARPRLATPSAYCNFTRSS